MNQNNIASMVSNIINKRSVIVLIGLVVILSFGYIYITYGIVVISSNKQQGFSYVDSNDKAGRSKSINTGFNLLKKGTYNLSYKNGEDTITKQFQVTDLFRVTKIDDSYPDYRKPWLQHIATNNRTKILRFGPSYYSYEPFDTRLIKHAVNDPLAINNGLVALENSDGMCQIVGRSLGALYCGVLYKDDGAQTSLYPVDLGSSSIDISKPIPLGNKPLFKLEPDALMTSDGRSISLYGSDYKLQLKVDIGKSLASNGYELLASKNQSTIVSVSGLDYKEMSVDSESKQVVNSNYTLYKYDLKTKTINQVEIKNFPPISAIGLNPSSEYITAQTPLGISVISTSSGREVFRFNSMPDSPVKWLDDDHIIYLSNTGINIALTSQQLTYPFFTNNNIRISSFNVEGNDVFVSAFYKHQSKQEPQAFVLNLQANEKTTNLNFIYDKIPYETNKYDILIDGSKIFAISKNIRGSGGSQDASSPLDPKAIKKDLDALFQNQLDWSILSLEIIQ